MAIKKNILFTEYLLEILLCHQEGIKQGIEQGIKLRNKEIAKNMLKQNCNIDFISQITGLSKEEVLDLQI